MKKERIFLIGTIGVVPTEDEKTNSVNFKINTVSDKSINASWWKIIVYCLY